MANIQLKAIKKQFDDTVVIPGLDLAINEGEFMVFVGPSGCGKSTMLRMIAGLETISSGDLLIDDVRVNDVTPSERGAAMVFQSYALYPHMTVAKNMGFGLKMSGMKKAEVTERVNQVAETLQITALLDRYPKQLSGGQRQRVAIGRSIVRRPKVFLFDEPLSNLDASLRVQMRIELAKMHSELKTTMIYVTHDQTEAMTLGNRIAVFNQGRIEQLGTPMSLYQNPQNLFVAQFLGAPKINIIDYEEADSNSVIKLTSGGSLSKANLSLSDSKTLRRGTKLGIRPEHLTVSESVQGIPITVDFLETLGDCVIIYGIVEGSEQRITAKIPQQTVSVSPGDQMNLTVQPDSILVFDAEGMRV